MTELRNTKKTVSTGWEALRAVGNTKRRALAAGWRSIPSTRAPRYAGSPVPFAIAHGHHRCAGLVYFVSMLPFWWRSLALR